MFTNFYVCNTPLVFCDLIHTSVIDCFRSHVQCVLWLRELGIVEKVTLWKDYEELHLVKRDHLHELQEEQRFPLVQYSSYAMSACAVLNALIHLTWSSLDCISCSGPFVCGEGIDMDLKSDTARQLLCPFFLDNRWETSVFPMCNLHGPVLAWVFSR